jgi:hypothetical protein
MTNKGKRVFEMLVRVLVFRNTIQELIVKDSQVDQCFRKIESALNRIAAQSTLQTSGQNDMRVSSEERTSAREGLREHLENLTRTASSMGLKQFFMPRNKNDRAMVDVARVFVQLAEPLKEEFVKYHVPEDFIERLKGGIVSLERAIQQQAAGQGSRRAATAAIATAEEEALTQLARLDPLMDNLLRENPPVRTAWYAARRIEAPRAKRGGGKEESPDPAPLAVPQAA